jgi:hypothetical protein
VRLQARETPADEYDSHKAVVEFAMTAGFFYAQ